jgi:cytochrome P450
LQDLAAPSALPWLGNLHQLNPKQLHAQLEAWGKALGPTYTFRLGRKRILVTSDVEIALSVLRDRPGRFRRLSTIEPVAAEMGSNGVFSIEGEAWRPQRDLVMRALAPQQLEGFFPTLQLISDRLRRRWQRSVEAQADTDALQDLTRFTVDTTATLVFGKDVNTLESGEDAIQRHIGVIFPMLSYRVNALLPYWRYFKLPKDYQLDRSLKVVRAFAEEMIGHARERMRNAPGESARPAGRFFERRTSVTMRACGSPNTPCTSSMGRTGVCGTRFARSPWNLGTGTIKQTLELAALACITPRLSRRPYSR